MRRWILTLRNTSAPRSALLTSTTVLRLRRSDPHAVRRAARNVLTRIAPLSRHLARWGSRSLTTTAVLFRAACRKAGLKGEDLPPLSTDHFRRPHDSRGQLGLFEAV